MRRLIAGLVLLLLLSTLFACGNRLPDRTTEAPPEIVKSSAFTEIVSAAQTTTQAPAETLPAAVPDALRARLDDVARQFGADAVQAAFLQNGQVTWLYSFGTADKSTGEPVTDETLFRCASLSKLAVAMTFMASVERGEASLTQDISSLLGFSLRAPGFPETPVTPQMLLTHTSSVQDGSVFLRSRNTYSSVPLEQLMQDGSCFTGSRPGTRYVYSNLGVALVAAGLEKHYETSFESLAQNALFRKLGIVCSFSAANLPGLPVANLYAPSGALQWSRARQMQDVPDPVPGQTHHIYQGNLTISARDYARLLEILLQNGCSGGVRILAADSVAQILTPQFTSGSFACGLGIKRSTALLPGRTVWCHAGSNYGMFSGFAADPSDGTGAVVFTSGASALLNDTGLYDVCAEMIRAFDDFR